MSASEQAVQEQENIDEVEETVSAEHEVTLDEALRLAQGHHKSGNLIIADRTYRDILRAVPDHFPTVHFLSALLFQRGDMEEALAFARKSTEVAPENQSCWVNYGITLSATGCNEEALEMFDKAIAINPESYEAYSNKSYALQLLERYEESEEVAVQATIIEPETPDAYINLGVALASQNKLKEAEAVWQQIVELDPKSSKAYGNLCNTLRSQGGFNEAKDKGLKAVELNEDNADAWVNLANVWRDLGELEKAEDAYRNAIELEPDNYLAHHNLAIALIDEERFREAVMEARYAIAFKKDSAEAHGNLAQSLQGMGKFQAAYQAADKAVALDPEKPEQYLNMADILLAVDRHDEADALIQKALSMDPEEPRTLMKLAEIRRGLDMMDEAVEAIDKAIANYDEMPHLFIQKAQILQMANRAEEALGVIDKALEKSPNFGQAILSKADILLTINRKDEAAALLEEAKDRVSHLPGYYWNMTSFKKFKEGDPDIEKIEAFIEGKEKQGPDLRATVHFTLYKVYEDIGDYETAFAHLKMANDAKRETKIHDTDNSKKGYENKKKLFSKAVIKRYEGKGCDSDVPVFICGMPRSGTTLTEQIISSHPQVYGAGELHDLGAVIREKGPLTMDNAAVMGEAYVEKIKKRDASGKALRITDKMPGNCNSIGLIHCILPNAKIILCRRDPIDNCLSCYKQNFAMGHNWAYDLEDLANHYKLFDDLMAYWRDVLPERFLEINYEETVNNFEEQARKLIDYVGLEWDDACLEPHKQKRAVLTASKNQVIKPIYKSSVEAWKRYEGQLQPLIEGLKAE